MLKQSLKETLQVEDQLLLTCVCAKRQEQTTLINKLIHTIEDWERVLAMAERHRVTSLLLQTLTQVATDVVPANILKQLQMRSAEIAKWDLLLTMELVTLLKLFNTHNVNVIPMKGPILALLAYNAIALRQYSDLDLLIRKEDIPRAKQLLVTAGYNPQIHLNASQEASFVDYHHDYAFKHQTKGLIVELHSGIKPKFYSIKFDHEMLWSSLCYRTLGDCQIPYLSPEYQFLTLCIHGASHCWERLYWIVDIAWLLYNTPHIDWNYLLTQAQQLRCKRILLLGLALAHELFDAPLSEEVAVAIKHDKAIKVLENQVFQQLFSATQETVEGMTQFQFYMKTREHWGDRIYYSVRLMIDPTINDWRLVTIPTPISFLYYLLRPIRLASHMIKFMQHFYRVSLHK